jgi:hypothetical protein
MRDIERSEIESWRATILASAAKAADDIRSTTGHGIELLRSLKFEQVGRHPFEDRALNVVEQVNQTFTCLVTLRAAELLFDWHPSLRKIRLNVGTRGGSDVESLDSTLAAEVFAAVTPTNNRKLAKDIAKVLARAYAAALGVQVWSVGI